MVVRVSWTIDPVEVGATGFTSNIQVVFAGRPEQVRAKLIAEPAGANTVKGMTSFCPRVTARFAGGGPNPTTTSISADEFPGANFESPSYCARMEIGPASNDEVFRDACPPAFTVPVPRETPFAKNVTVPEGVPAVLVTVALKVTGC